MKVAIILLAVASVQTRKFCNPVVCVSAGSLHDRFRKAAVELVTLTHQHFYVCPTLRVRWQRTADKRTWRDLVILSPYRLSYRGPLNTGRFIMFFVITNIYTKKTKGPALMELFTATGKLIFFF